jgi:hypothetical protein
MIQYQRKGLKGRPYCSWEDNDGTELILKGGLKEWIKVALVRITVV